MCILFIYTLLKVVNYYDLSEHSVHVSDVFPKKIWMEGDLHLSLFWIIGIFLTLQSHLWNI